MKLLIVLIAIIQGIVRVQSEDYCNIYHCGQRHIACNNDGRLSLNCPSSAIVANVIKHKDLILELHNNVRNAYAEGVGSLPPAGRMAQMVWCDELSEMALLNVKTCEMKHDECRSTLRAPFSGQNIGLYSYTTDEPAKTVAWLVENRFNAWVNESINVTPDEISKYPEEVTGEQIGHFTLVVTDRATHVGCAAIRYKIDGYRNFLLTCNYASNNIIGKPVYKTSETSAADCETGVSDVYPKLCSIDEEYYDDKVN
ncbi:antigen 5 like allergen Cul n 1-like [Teleopsis dalmanni]|uniref:antigen 5 like allergen Cul n 1-like n=1 Tax=Teleopsis dalmanni TaxID=139649 RepID=UPI0018CF16DC|nr:antigen 5 like allergen Cul n 1-like [Teleopsis dalmanni]